MRIQNFNTPYFSAARLNGNMANRFGNSQYNDGKSNNLPEGQQINIAPKGQVPVFLKALKVQDGKVVLQVSCENNIPVKKENA